MNLHDFPFPTEAFFDNYHATVIDVFDGHTIVVELKIGLNTLIRPLRIRLFGIEAPAIRPKASRQAGLLSRDWLQSKIPLGSDIRIRIIPDKSGSLDRLLGVVWTDDTTNINLLSLAEKMSRPFKGK